MAHVLVPPSACKTSQSTFIVFSPIALKFNAVLKDLPISLCISIVLPDCLPEVTSLFVLDDVEPGNMEYSAVNHPVF